MTVRYFYIGGTGPFIYDDTDIITSGEWGYRDGETRGSVLTDGGIKTSRLPADAQDMTRLQDVGLMNIEYFTAAGTITSTKSIVYADGTFDLFMPTVVDGTRRFYEVKNKGSGIVSLKANASEPTVELEEETCQPLYPGDSFTMFTDGTDWRVI